MPQEQKIEYVTIDYFTEFEKRQNGRFDELITIMMKRFDQVDERFDRTDRRIDHLEISMNDRFGRVDERLSECVKRSDLKPILNRISRLEVAAGIE